jgi:transcriptional regulator with XRE-family HTH domain
VKSFDGFCWKLRCAMKSSGLTRVELADRLGLKPSAIKAWVVGRRSPTVRRLLALSSVLGVEPSQLFDEPADMPVVTTCEACGQTFRRAVGHRIHVGLKAKDCPKHAALHLASPPPRTVDIDAA